MVYQFKVFHGRSVTHQNNILEFVIFYCSRMEDALFTVRNAFYAGDYGTVIHSLEGKINSAEDEEVLYLYVRSKIALGLSSEVIQILDSAGSGISEALRLLAQTVSVPTVPGEAIKESANQIVQNYSTSLSGRILAPLGIALLRVGETEAAFKILTQHQGDSLEW